MCELDWLFRQLDNNDSIRDYTGFFSFRQATMLEKKPDLCTVLHVEFKVTNKRMPSEGLTQIVGVP